MKQRKKICIIGLGYIGLPSASLFVKKGFNVYGVDSNKKIVSTVNSGNVHIAEPDLNIKIKSAVQKGFLKAYNKIQQADIYLICVPTPLKKFKGKKSPNIDIVLDVAKKLKPFVKSGDFIILESTSPVGTTKKIENILLGKSKTELKNIHIAYCPERVLPGKIIKELEENDRIIGGLSKLSTSKIANFYRKLIKGRVYETDAKTAEMCKLTENSFRDLNIAFANELSLICDKENIDVFDLIKLANKHPRVNILQPGIGVGGHCIAVDPWFVVDQNYELANIIRTSREVNDNKTLWVLNKIINLALKFQINKGYKPKIACLGISFKPNIDDLRESPALKIVEGLIKKGFDVSVFEPNIQGHEKFKLIKDYNLINENDLICVLVKHKEFLKPRFKQNLKKNKTLDFCGLFEKIL